ncbi:hypothetical protein ACH42_01240 [Endozoicomonas sp. (ex Bugula neritina AB1)]|nr:hypothetical protein ACH42_01240 [Endozoicomonas sp. (ex Bugula neritina AB1)]
MFRPENFRCIKTTRTGVYLALFIFLIIFFSFIIYWIVVALEGNTATSSNIQRFGPSIDSTTNTADTSHSENISITVKFIEDLQYREWEHDPYIRPTGDIHRTTSGKIIDGTTHHRVRIYYSPDVVNWLKKCRNEQVKAPEKECSPSAIAKLLPDGATMVKEMYKSVPPVYPDEDSLIGWAVMIRKNGASPDGWFWVIHFKKEFRSMATMGSFTYSFCLTCHASAKTVTSFASYKNLLGNNATLIKGRSYTPIVYSSLIDNLLKTDIPTSGDVRPHRTTSDPAFLATYGDPSIYTDGIAPTYSPSKTGPVFPNAGLDHVWNQVLNKKKEHSHLTSSNCIGCHDATSLVNTRIPNMLMRNPVHNPHTGVIGEQLLNLSVYGEWRTSPMGMAGRDPVFFAQLESEMNTYPDLAGPIQNLCLSCHAEMGERQYSADRARPENKNNPAFQKKYFDLSMVFATSGPLAKYGALSRDGISCMTCHQMDPAHVNVAPHKLPTTGHFKRSPDTSLIFGSSAENEFPGGSIRTTPMKNALGLTPTYDPYVNSSNMCGTCHVIQLKVRHPTIKGHFHAEKPQDDKGNVMLSRAHEQNTYLEWLYSGYQTNNPEIPVNDLTARTCQNCHMTKDFRGNRKPLSPKVANVQDSSWPIPSSENLSPVNTITVPERPNVGRHQLFGMNLFALSFYEQFTKSIFGLSPDTMAPPGTLPSQTAAIEEGLYQIKHDTATIQILDTREDKEKENLIVRVKVSNKAGHKMPSGVGFRRAWIELNVNDKGNETLWGSGMTNPQGVIMSGSNRLSAPLKSEFTAHWQHIQPHWEVISREDQVQIYEERYLNQINGEYLLNTSFLGIGKVVKDNRLLPEGFHYDFIKEALAKAVKRHQEKSDLQSELAIEKWQSLMPVCLLGQLDKSLPKALQSPLPEGANDPNFDDNFINGNGSDIVTYKIPLNRIKGAASVAVQLNYQNLPPYYLRDRFKAGQGGPQTQRLYYLIGYIQTKGTPIEGWKIKVVEDKRFLR